MSNDELVSTALEIRILTAIVAKRAMHAVKQRLNAVDASISGLQYGIMHAIHHKEQTISELSHKLMLDPSTLVPAVDALERKGLAKRGRDPQDRRRVPLSLTQRGAEFVNSIPIADENDLLVQSLSAMGDEKARQLLALLHDMVEHMPEGKDILERVLSRVRSHTASTTSMDK